MDKQFHPTLYNMRKNLPMAGLVFIYIYIYIYILEKGTQGTQFNRATSMHPTAGIFLQPSYNIPWLLKGTHQHCFWLSHVDRYVIWDQSLALSFVLCRIIMLGKTKLRITTLNMPKRDTSSKSRPTMSNPCKFCQLWLKCTSTELHHITNRTDFPLKWHYFGHAQCQNRFINWYCILSEHLVNMILHFNNKDMNFNAGEIIKC